MPVKLVNLSSEPLSSRLTPTEFITKLLANRDIATPDTFLNPPYPALSLKLSRVVKLIRHHLKSGSNILIYGDYDVDGLASTALIWQALYPLNHRITPFIPHRQKDGYGFKADSFIRLESERGIKFDLLITVDNGIVAVKEFEKIKKHHPLDIVVVDHHLPSDLKTLTSTVDGLVHSTAVSGSALSWFFAREFTPDADLGLAALGTVADCLPLLDVNRSLVYHGLEELHLNPSPGIKKLCQLSQIDYQKLTTYNLGFQLSPRLNAIGRLDDPTDGLRLLCSPDLETASKYANRLNEFNQNRQDLQKESLEAITATLKLLPEDKIIIVVGNFHPGIIGLIASHLTEKYFLPSIVITNDGEIAKGSCRSIPSLNIITTLREFQKLFVDLGGHSGAAGFSLHPQNITKLSQAITKSVNQKLADYVPQSTLVIDAILDPAAVTLPNCQALAKLAPFGIGFPEPLFLLENLLVENLKIIGQSANHLKLRLSGLDTIAFNRPDLAAQIKTGDVISLVARLSLNTWNNLTTPQLVVKELISH